jgi:hypothetical protein
MKTRMLLFLIVLVGVLAGAAGCAPAPGTAAPAAGTSAITPNPAEPAPTATDYSKREHWLALPDTNDKPVDVFYLYPTSWQKKDSSDPNICNIDNPTMLAASQSAFARQATAFEPVGNIYAPYYRPAAAG